MIVTEAGDHVRFVTQPAHADLAGQFADRWGNDRIEPPSPCAPALIAARHHDAGWVDYDRRPHLDDDGRPVDFRHMPADPWIDLYDEGIERVVELDAYAGLLVSMHGTGLRRRRYGLSPSWPETPPAFRSFVDRQEEAQARLAEQLRAADRLSPADAALLSHLHEAGSAPESPESRLWDNYRRLQAWDALSLSFCTTESPPSISEIPAVPTGDGDGTLSVEAVEDGFRIEPYPFDTAPLVVSVPTRTVPGTAFDDAERLLDAYYRAGQVRERFTIRRE